MSADAEGALEVPVVIIGGGGRFVVPSDIRTLGVDMYRLWLESVHLLVSKGHPARIVRKA